MQMFRLNLLMAGFALAAAAAPANAPSHGVDLNGLDRSVAPGDGFDRYANGGWRDTTPIPADRSSLGAFVTVTMQVEARNADLIRAARQMNGDADAHRIVDYHAAYLDVATIERRGLAGLQPVMAEIDGIRGHRDLSRVIGGTLRADVDPLNATSFWTENLFGVFVSQATDTPHETLPYLLQGGIGMPDRDYYLSDAPAMIAVRDAYGRYVADVASQLGWRDAGRRAAAVVALETKIASAHATAVEAQDARKAERWRQADFDRKAPGIDWRAFFAAAQLAGRTDVIAWHPEPTVALAKLVGSEPLAVWQDWLRFHAVSKVATVLPKAYDDLRFGFYGRALSGTRQPRLREKRALVATSSALADAVGKLYVARHFPAASKAQVETMVRNMTVAFDRRLAAIDWMAPATKAEARRKIATLRVGIGYPSRWRDYSSLTVRHDDALGNLLRAQLAEYRHQLTKIGRPVDKDEWWLAPHTVNAVFLPLQNAMNFPAGILEPPFYDPNADPAFNYGSIGSVIGHEISHSFDNLGADFDADGRVRNWWTKEDLARFKAAGMALVAQYNGYRVLPDLPADGTLTLGENIADLAGLAVAYDAYRASLAGKAAPIIYGLTGDQRFFLAYAQSRRESMREATMRALTAADVHSLGRFRAETVRNLDAWYGAFDVRPGQKLYLSPEKRVRVW